ncbi:MAG: sigma 54-interacting transcriptional regulator [Myxococcales bacterium]
MSKPTDDEDYSLPWRRRSASVRPETLWLSIAWSLEEPERLGEVACLEEGALLGRGEPLADEATGKRLGFSKLRPGNASPPSWLLDSRVSRQQLQFSQLSADSVRVTSIGRCPLSVNGSPVKGAALKAGDVISLRNALLLLVTRRTSPVPVRHAALDFEFGWADRHGLVGESAAAWSLRESLAFAGQSREHVLLFGDSGSGKELSARAIHALSPRGHRPLVSRNAATLPEALVDAELFGNAKNYPNPGMLERSGLIGEADGSSLFLDEIGELSRTAQAHLLRVLDHAGEYQRLGEARARASDFRLISATNRDVATLKHDFAARFSLRVRLPGLNERLEDIPLLVRAILRRLANSSPALLDRFFERRGSQIAEPRIEPEVVELLLRREYRTHLRELERLLWTALSTSEDDFIAATPEFVREAAPGQTLEAPEPEREAIEQALAAAKGNVTKAARLLGLRNRYVLYRVLRKLRIE